MAVGDQTDVLNRLQALVPASWFKGGQPEETAVLGGIAGGQSFIYALAAYAKAQTRLQSTTDGFLDLAAWDFFGPLYQRNAGETDAAFLARIMYELMRERVTRKGVVEALTDLTGIAPVVTEPWSPNDTGAYGYGFYGYCDYGSLLLRNQIFVTAYRPSPGGIANVAGYGYGFYGAPTTAYVDLSEVDGPVTDAQIYATVASTIAAGITAWVTIENFGAALSLLEQLASGIPLDLGSVADADIVLSGDLGTVALLAVGNIDLGALPVTNTLLLTESNKVPFGVALEFNSEAAALAYFGAGAEATLIGQYYADGATSTVIVIRYPVFGGNARVYGAPLGLTLAGLRAISGTLTITADGYPFSATINLSGAASFAAAATAIENALNTTLPVAAVCPASSIAPVTFSVAGYVSGDTLYVTATPADYLYPGSAMSGGGLHADDQIENQITPLLPGEALGGVGRYALIFGQPAGIAQTTFTASYGIVTLGSVSSGQPAVGQTVEGTVAFNSSVAQGGAIIYANTDPGAGLGSLSWMVDQAQTVASTTLTLIGTPVHVTWNAQALGAFAVQGCNIGASYGGAHTMSFAGGTAAAALGLTQATGARLSSPGQIAPSPAAFMAYCLTLAADWRGFQIIPTIDSPGFAPTQAEAFEAWAQSEGGAYAFLGQSATTMLPGA